MTDNPQEQDELSAVQRLKSEEKPPRDPADNVVDEYEMLYGRVEAEDLPPKRKNSERAREWASQSLPPRHKRAPRPIKGEIGQDERFWATMSHASALLTVTAVFASFGVAALVTLFVPLAIYLYYRNKSEYVARHALQAFAAQAVGSIGFMVLMVAVILVIVVASLVSVLLMLVLVGFVLLPLVLLVGVLAIFAVLMIPLALLIYAMIASVEAWNTNNYSYPWLGDWVDDQLYGGT